MTDNPRLTGQHQAVIDAYWRGEKVRDKGWRGEHWLRKERYGVSIEWPSTSLGWVDECVAFVELMHGLGDWEIYHDIPEQLTLEEAMKAMEEGKAVRHSCMSSDRVCYMDRDKLIRERGSSEAPEQCDKMSVLGHTCLTPEWVVVDE